MLSAIVDLPDDCWARGAFECCSVMWCVPWLFNLVQVSCFKLHMETGDVPTLTAPSLHSREQVQEDTNSNRHVVTS